MRADLTAERERLSDRIATLEALLSFTLRRLAAERQDDRNGLVYVAARRHLAERRRNAAADALECIYSREDAEKRERLEDARDHDTDMRIKARKEARHG